MNVDNFKQITQPDCPQRVVARERNAVRKNNSDDLARDRLITTVVILVQIAMVILFATVIWILTRFNPMACLLAGVVGWSMVLFKTPVFDWFFVNVGPNFVVILGNQIKYDKIPDRLMTGEHEGRDPRTTMFDLRSLREVGPGMRGKWPWEKVYQSVDLRTEIVIGNNDGKKPLICYTKFNISLRIVWQVVLTPLRGSCVNLVRKGEKALIDFFTGYFEQYIIGWVKSQTEEKVFTELAEKKPLERAFSHALDGPWKVSQIEEDSGLFTNTPQIISIERSESYQRAAEGNKVGEQIGKILDGLKEKLPGADPNMLLAVATALAGEKVEGLVLLPGNPDPKAIAALLASTTKEKGRK